MGDAAPEEFIRHVRDCLTHLYDFTELQMNPLASQIAPDFTGLERVQTVRRVLIETIEQLKPRETSGIPSRQERVYTLLLMRYIEGLSVQEVIQQLALGERQFYREHQRAVQTLSQLLWDRLEVSQPEDNTISVKSEIQRIWNQSSYTMIDSQMLLSEVIAANANLAEQHQVAVYLHPELPLGDFAAHYALLRQTIIWMLSQIITHTSAGSKVALSSGIVEHDPVINFEILGLGTDELSVLHETLANNQTVSEFLATLQGTIAITKADDGFLVQLQVKRQRQIILVIDDNPDAAALLERYVTGMPYEIYSVYEADEGFRLIEKLEPSWIVLDIMLPHTDGWKMLQNLKAHPQTQAIPVLVCSVLENPDLALSLGADAYLRKPPDRISFLHVLGGRVASEQ